MGQEYSKLINSNRPKSRTMLGVHQAILSLLKSDEKKQILDLGAGEGALSEKLFLLGHNITACDGEPEQFKFKEIICQRVNLNKNFPFNDSEFDVVILSDVIEHLENPWHTIRESHRILRNNGKLIISIPNILSITARIHFLIHGEFLLFYQAKEEKSFPHITPLSYPLVEKILITCGFKVNKILSNVPFIKECDEWEKKNASWYRYSGLKIFSITNIIGTLVKLKVKFSKYIYKREGLLNDTFFYGEAIIIETLKE